MVLRQASALFLVFTVLTTWSADSTRADEIDRVSRFGEYRGYSTPSYDGRNLTSLYVTVRDGTKLAVDIVRPTRNGKVENKPLPVVWTLTRYHRDKVGNNPIEDWIERFSLYGYVVATVDVRGSGASYGSRQGWFAPEEARDAYDITEWLAARPWSDGNIGMFGRSYLGMTQFFAASQAPPHLKAIFPEMVAFDLYDSDYPGGIYGATGRAWFNLFIKMGDFSMPFQGFRGSPARPVDADSDGSLLQGAIREHFWNWDVFTMSSQLPYRNSRDPFSNTMIHRERSLGTYAKQIESAGIPVYLVGGWFDIAATDAIKWFKNHRDTKKVVIGPWRHVEVFAIDLLVEHLRWFDFWLKGIDNGIMEEPPLRYWTLGAPAGKQWRTARDWPPPGQERVDFYFASGRSGSIDSTNDGMLRRVVPKSGHGKDEYVVDYSTASGGESRWQGGPMNMGRSCTFEECGVTGAYPDRAQRDAKGLTFTTPPLEADIEVTGHAVAHLWVTSSAKDGDFFVYLEEVLPDGRSVFLSDGMLRASHRAIHKPPHDFFGLPWHRSYEEDVAELPDEPVELAIVLQPTSNIFEAGHRIRVTITGADWDKFFTPRLPEAPTVTVYRNGRHASRITLPFIPNSK